MLQLAKTARCLSSHRLSKRRKVKLYDSDFTPATTLSHQVISIHLARRMMISTQASRQLSCKTPLFSPTTRSRIPPSQCGSTGMTSDLDELLPTDSKPSRQKDECKQGMVFAINPKDQDQFNQFAAKAAASSLNSTNSTTEASNGTTIHTLNLTTNTTVHVVNSTSATNITRPLRFRGRRGYTKDM